MVVPAPRERVLTSSVSSAIVLDELEALEDDVEGLRHIVSGRSKGGSERMQTDVRCCTKRGSGDRGSRRAETLF